MGKRPVLGLTALWLGLAVFGCDCCNKKASFRKDSTFNPPPTGGKDVSGVKVPPEGPPTSANGGYNSYPGTNTAGARSTGMGDPYNPPARTTDPYTPPRTSGAPAYDSGMTSPSKSAPASGYDTGVGSKYPQPAASSTTGWDSGSPSSSSVMPTSGSSSGFSTPSTGSARPSRDDFYNAPPAKTTTEQFGSLDNSFGRGSSFDDHKAPMPPMPTGLPKTTTTVPELPPAARPSAPAPFPPLPSSAADSVLPATKEKDMYNSLPPATKSAPAPGSSDLPPPPQAFPGDKLPGPG